MARVLLMDTRSGHLTVDADFCQQRFDTAPADTHTNTQHDESRKSHYRLHTRASNPFTDSVGVAINQ